MITQCILEKNLKLILITQMIKFNIMNFTKLLIGIILFLSIDLYSQDIKLGAIKTFGRNGLGGIVQIDKRLLISYESGQYSGYNKLYGTESIQLRQYSLITTVSHKKQSSLLLGIGYNDFYKYEGKSNIINPDNLSKISLDFGFTYDFGIINTLFLFDIVNFEGKIGFLIEI